MAVNRSLAVAGAAGLAILLIAGTPPPRPASSFPHTPRSLRSVLPELKSFVERNRLLSFRRGVDVFVLNDRDFDAGLARAGPGAGDPARQFQQSKVLVGFVKALGLGGPDFQLLNASPGGTRSVLGLYDDANKRISVRDGLPKGLQRRVLVHELTHALDDQHFPLARLRSRVDLRTEQARALQALVEGDAARIDRRYSDSLPARERAAAGADAPAEGVTATPAADAPFFGLVTFPYVAGPNFVQGLIDRKGMSAVNAAFRVPPTTSQEVLHPDRFLHRAPSVTVRQPAAEATPVAVGVLGEIGLRLVLGESLAHPLAADLAAAWGGDRYVAWSDSDQTCVRVSVVMNTVGDAAHLRDGLRQWATAHPGADMRLSGNQTTITRCA
jgi:hypothetical protein